MFAKDFSDCFRSKKLAPNRDLPFIQVGGIARRASAVSTMYQSQNGMAPWLTQCNS